MKIKVELNSAGIISLLRSNEIKAIMEDKAQLIMRNTGDADGYEAHTHPGQKRANVTVLCMTREAKQDNLKNNTLLKAMGSVHD